MNKTEKTIDIYELLTSDELEQVTDIFLEALAREKNLTTEVFEIETKIISNHFISNEIAIQGVSNEMRE